MLGPVIPQHEGRLKIRICIGCMVSGLIFFVGLRWLTRHHVADTVPCSRNICALSPFPMSSISFYHLSPRGFCAAQTYTQGKPTSGTHGQLWPKGGLSNQTLKRALTKMAGKAMGCHSRCPSWFSTRSASLLASQYLSSPPPVLSFRSILTLYFYLCIVSGCGPTTIPLTSLGLPPLPLY